MKQNNVKIMKRLVVLLMLSCLLIGLRLAVEFFCYEGFFDPDTSNPEVALSVASDA